MAISSKTAKHSRTSISFSSLFLTMESLSQESEGLSSGLGVVGMQQYGSGIGGVAGSVEIRILGGKR